MPRGEALSFRRRRCRIARDFCAGFGYLAVLFMLAIMAVGWAALGVVWETTAAREREEELLYIGQQFRSAICRYYEDNEAGEKRFPPSLEALLADQRSARTKRHLRRIYPDPVMGKTEWGLLKSADDRIQGVFSLSKAEPLKSAHFDVVNRQFEGARHYSDWVFVYHPEPVRPDRAPCHHGAGSLPP